MPMVFSRAMTNSSPPPADQRLLLGSVVFALGAVCLVVVWFGLGRLAYDIVVDGVLSGLVVKVLVLALVYTFGVGLGSVSRTRFDNPVFPRLARAAAWIYLLLVWLTYLGIILQVDRQQYSLLEYLSFLALLLVELVALSGLRLITSDKATPFFALSLLVIVLFQLLLIVYRYVFASAPMSLYLGGDLLLLLAMGTVSSAMLGEDAFKAFIERFIEKVG
jgi:hypothetical protein